MTPVPQTIFEFARAPRLPYEDRYSTPAIIESETSRAAARRIAPSARSIQTRVLNFIRQRGERGATDHEVSSELRILADTSRARRCELRDAGDIVDSGQRRPSPRGQASVVWIVAEASR